VNNELGFKAVNELNQLLSRPTSNGLIELRIASVKTNPLDLKRLLEGIQQAFSL
jgi:hypothetical protein